LLTKACLPRKKKLGRIVAMQHRGAAGKEEIGMDTRI
jgi:hypothetical protein